MEPVTARDFSAVSFGLQGEGKKPTKKRMEQPAKKQK